MDSNRKSWLFCLTVSLPMHFSDPERLLQREEIVQGECVKNTERSKIVLSPTKANSADAQLHILLCQLTYYAALLPRRGPHNASHSVCPSVCPSVPLSLPSVMSRHLANYNDTHVLFGTRRGPHIVRPSRPHKFLFVCNMLLSAVSDGYGYAKLRCFLQRNVQLAVDVSEMKLQQYLIVCCMANGVGWKSISLRFNGHYST